MGKVQKKKKKKGKKVRNVAPLFAWNDEYFPEEPTNGNQSAIKV